ncbi:MAG TPA: trigger factor [Gemmatimonadaceae bacterium]|nr:trigger factor [Gemmatimonadaceae bacterium]
MELEITTKKSEGGARHLEVRVPAETVADAEDKAARRYATKLRLPGFRPGKAPAAIVRKRFGPAIREEALNSLLNEAYKEILEREKIQPAGQPRVEHVHFDEGQPLTFELHVEVRPEIVLARTTGFRVQRNRRAVTDEQVHEQIEHLRDQRAAWTPLDEKPMPGDLVSVELATADESGEMPEPKQYQVVLGAGQAIPGVEEVIMEATPGQTLERPVKWPDDFPDETQRGTTKAVRVKLVDVKRKQLPDLDDAFAREVGDFDSIDALNKTVREDLDRHADRDADAEVRQRLVDDIISANPFDIPRSWVDQMVEAYIEAYQVPEEERERFRGEFRAVAERQVRRDLVIETIADKQHLKASESDIDARVAEVAEKRNADPGQVYASLQKAGRIRELERSITEDKVFGWLMEQNIVE